MQGIINVLKPAGMTSHDVIYVLRKIYGIRKMGHSGTLDPLAAGVLPVFLGKATRLLAWAPTEPKVYLAEWLVGIATDTEDTSGTIVQQMSAIPKLTAEQLETAAALFRGTILQRPSQYSAIKVDGRKAYELARKNQKVELPAREITIHEFTDISYQLPYLRACIVCSQGTYIRALGRDFGEALGVPLTMSFLVREQVGNFTLEDAWTLEEIRAAKEAALRPATDAVRHLPQYRVPTAAAERFRHGQTIRGTISDVTALWCDEQFIGLGKPAAEGGIRPYKVWVEE
ncbi:MAG: tRNA pseudouridine(55) synthase TruB [Negativicoccus succinicivorans]|nr:tRNA pseudouridine(55) synthase TruB [Negativicoccus succinicivorans]